MSKRDTLAQELAGNLLESIGAAPSQAPGGVNRGGSVGAPPRMQGVTRGRNALDIALERIERDPRQPREEFEPEALARLAESLRVRGQLQPVRVRWDEGRGAYVIIAGERRWRAAGMAGLTTLACIVDDSEMSADELLAVQLVENALREDLRPIEQARAYRALMDAKGWSGHQLARELHVGQSSVARTLALLDLPSAVQEQVEQGGLPASTAAEIAKLPGAGEQAEVARAAVEMGLTRSEVAEFVQAKRARRSVPTARPEPVTLDLGDGLTVSIRWRKANGVTALQAARRLVKALLDRERDGAAA